MSNETLIETNPELYKKNVIHAVKHLSRINDAIDDLSDIDGTAATIGALDRERMRLVESDTVYKDANVILSAIFGDQD